MRLAAAAVAAGIGGGLVGGVGARLAMFVVRVLNPSHNGEVTHANAEVGRWTLDGTLGLVADALATGALAGIAYLLVRAALPRRSWVWRGLAFGGLVLAAFGRVVLEPDYEYVRYVDPAVSVGLFAALFPLHGVTVAAIADRVAPLGPGRLGLSWPRHLVQLVLLLVALVSLVGLVRDLAATYWS